MGKSRRLENLALWLQCLSDKRHRDPPTWWQNLQSLPDRLCRIERCIYFWLAGRQYQESRIEHNSWSSAVWRSALSRKRWSYSLDPWRSSLSLPLHRALDEYQMLRWQTLNSAHLGVLYIAWIRLWWRRRRRGRNGVTQVWRIASIVIVLCSLIDQN